MESQRPWCRSCFRCLWQEWALAQGHSIPAYRIKGREGPDHAPVFVVEVAVGDRQPAEGEGLNKRLAEQAAAKAFLLRENLRT